MKDIKGAIAYLNTIKNRQHLGYAERVFACYRDYGTPRQSGAPDYTLYNLPSSTERRISNTIRYYMVGDCDPAGHLLDSNGKRI